MAGHVNKQDLEAVPKAQAQPERSSPEAVVDAVAEAFGISREVVPERCDQAAFQASVYLLRRVANLSLKEVSELAGISISRVSHIQRAIEHSTPGKALRQLLNKYKVKSHRGAARPRPP